MFARLHQTQMPLRHGKLGNARQEAQCLQPRFFRGTLQNLAVAGATYLVEDDTGKFQRRVMADNPLQDGARRRPHTLGVHDQQNGEIERAGEFRGRTVLMTALPRNAVEEAHDAFDNHRLAARSLSGEQRIEARPPHRPDIEVEAGFAGRSRMKAGIDVIGTGLAAHDLHPARPEEREQRQGG